ncbi:MAG: glucose-6-phosphate isomerase [Candidatus Sericytochromatia bacterium]|nr:glucose-6-phosphate isomerase [Candidatus Sericytochromatia bacterium]
MRIDVSDAMAARIGPRGLDAAAIMALQPQIDAVHAQLTDLTGAGRDFLGFLDLPVRMLAQLPAIRAAADQLIAAGDTHVVLGIGGSYLGAKTLFNALTHPYHNQLPAERRGWLPKIYFAGTDLDSRELNGLLDLLPARGPVLPTSGFTVNVVSKSGTTLETAVAFRILWKRLKTVYGDLAAKQVVATTDPDGGALRQMAQRENFTTLPVPPDVGGRYSVLSAVGLLPAAVFGADVAGLLAGAADMAERCRTADLNENPAYRYAATMFHAQQRGYHIRYLAAWAKGLETLVHWHDQLCAESLGKDGRGPVPIAGMVTRDLHARGQQIQDGSHDTLVVNLVVNRTEPEIAMPDDPGDPDGLNYLAGQTLGHMQRQAWLGTTYAYCQAGRPSVHIVLDDVSAYSLGQLIYMLEVATVAEGYLMGINPLDQPGVEAYKRSMFALLDRPDMAGLRAKMGQLGPDLEQVV